MALSGIMGNTFKKGWRLQIDWTATQSTTGNYSSVTAKLYLISQASYYTIRTSQTQTCSITINGNTQSGSFSPSLSGNQKKLILTHTATVPHNSDGTKTFGLDGWADLKVTLSGVYINRVNLNATNYTLNTIPRKSTVAISGTKDVDLGVSGITIKTNKASSSFTHIMRIYAGGLLVRTVTDPSSTYVFTPTSTEQIAVYQAEKTRWSKIPGRVEVDTKSGSTVLGTDAATISWTMNNKHPIFPGIAWKDTNTTAISITGTDQETIQGLSRVQLSIPSATRAMPQAYANMKPYTVTFEGRTTTIPYTTSNILLDLGVVKNDTSSTIKVVAEDSRGLKTTKEVLVNVHAYTPPLVEIVAERNLGFSTSVNIVVGGQFSPVTIGTVNKNTINSAQYRYRQLPSGSFSSWYTINTTLSITKTSFNYGQFASNMDNTYSWEIEARVKDNINNVYQYATAIVQSGVYPWMFEGDGNIRYKGALIQTGNEKTLADDGTGVSRFGGATGTDAGVRAMKMGDNYTATGAATEFPSRTGAWIYFQNAKNGGDAGTDYNSDFFFWKDRNKESNDLYIGHMPNYGGVSEIGKIVTIVEEGDYSRSGTTGHYIKYSDGRLYVEWERVFTSSNFVGSTVVKRWITPNIYFMSPAFIAPPVITSNTDKGEIYGFANRETFTTYFNLSLMSLTSMTAAVTVRGVAQGRWR